MRRRRPTRARAPAVAGPVLRSALAVALLAGLAILFVWSRTRAIAASFELGELQRAQARLTTERDRLRLEVETLSSPALLERVARTRLGMAPPAPGAVLAAGSRIPGGGDGRVGRPTGPEAGRAAAGARASSSDAPRATVVPGERVALRGPSRGEPAARGE